MFCSCILTFPPGAKWVGSPHCSELLTIRMGTGFELPAPQHRQTHTPAAMRTLTALRAWTQHSSPKNKAGSRSAVESISIHRSTQPACLSNTSCTPFSLFWDISSYISGYISDPLPMQSICSQHMTADSCTVCEAVRKHLWLPTWSRAFFNNSVLFTCTPSKWLTGFLWREISLAGTTARLHSLYRQRGRLTQHKHSA